MCLISIIIYIAISIISYFSCNINNAIINIFMDYRLLLIFFSSIVIIFFILMFLLKQQKLLWYILWNIFTYAPLIFIIYYEKFSKHSGLFNLPILHIGFQWLLVLVGNIILLISLLITISITKYTAFIR